MFLILTEANLAVSSRCICSACSDFRFPSATGSCWAPAMAIRTRQDGPSRQWKVNRFFSFVRRRLWATDKTTRNSNLRFCSSKLALSFPFVLCWPRHPISSRFDLPALQGPALNYLDRAVQWAEECDLEAWV